MSEYPTGPGESSKNSVFGSVACQSIAKLPILQLRDSAKGQEGFDIVDEVIYHFRTNIFMRDFKIKTDADRLLIYLTYYAMKCLKTFAKNQKNRAQCQKEIDAWNLDKFPIPGEGGFILQSLCGEPTPAEKEPLRKFLISCRRELGNRLINIVFKDGVADKWWICFAPRKFMDKEMVN